jgi:hypothetical protein
MQELEQISLHIVEGLIDLPPDAILGSAAYTQLQVAMSTRARYSASSGPISSLPAISAMYLPAGQVYVRVSRHVDPWHVSIGDYTSYNIRLFQTLMRLGLNKLSPLRRLI